MAGTEQTPVRFNDVDYGSRKREAIRSFLLSMHQTTADNIIIHTAKTHTTSTPTTTSATASASTTATLQNIHRNEYGNLRNYRLGTMTPTVSPPSTAPSSALATLAEVEDDGDDNHDFSDDVCIDDNGSLDFQASNELNGSHVYKSSVFAALSLPAEGDIGSEMSTHNANLALPVDFGPIPEFSIPAGESNDEYRAQTASADIENETKQEQDNEDNTRQYVVERRIAKAIEDEDVKFAMEIFETARRSNVDISLKIALDLFFGIVDINPIKAYKVFNYCTSHQEFRGGHYPVYRRMCKSLKHLDPKKHYQIPIVNFVESFLAQLDSIDDMKLKRQCYPKLVNALASQRTVSVGKYAFTVYKYMVDNDFPMSPGWLMTLLSFSKYNRQDDLPFHDILARLAAWNKVPYPPIALKAVQHMFPFNDSQATKIALESILEFHTIQEQFDNHSIPPYHICMATLEAMSAGAARSGDVGLILTVWDAIDAFNHKPTEAMYENTIVAFAASSETLTNVFSAIDSMMADGFRPTRALIRSVSHVLR